MNYYYDLGFKNVINYVGKGEIMNYSCNAGSAQTDTLETRWIQNLSAARILKITSA